MTNLEAKEKLYMEWQKLLDYDLDYAGISEAYKMAFKALEQEVCRDAIDRQAVLDLAEKGVLVSNGNYKSVCKAINDLPPVNPQVKTGQWEQYGNSWEDKFKCSECGKEQPKILCGERIIGHWSDYCPNCGAKMVEPQDTGK